MIAFDIIIIITLIVVCILVYFLYIHYNNLLYKTQVNSQNIEKIATILNKNNNIIEDEIKLLLK